MLKVFLCDDLFNDFHIVGNRTARINESTHRFLLTWCYKIKIFNFTPHRL